MLNHALQDQRLAGPFAAIQAPRSVGIVHDWCPAFRGGERVVAEIANATGARDVFTLFDFLPAAVKDAYFKDIQFHTSAVDRLPYVKKFYRSLFFLCPFLIEQFDVTPFDIVISSSAAFARGVITRPDQPHLCYVHSPIRYAWDEQFSYLEQGGLGFGPMNLLYRLMLHWLRTWDTRTAHGPDVMVANSRFVRSRIRRIYGRTALVIPPPVPVDTLPLRPSKADYYVTASFLVPYKRTDLLVKAFRSLPGRRLVVVGEGQQLDALRRVATPNVTFAGYLSRPDYVEVIAGARAFLFAGCEDFGISLAEAQACGTPVIAFGRGGARDIVVPHGCGSPPTGILFAQQSESAVRDAVLQFEKDERTFDPGACRRNAERFAPDLFRSRILNAMELAVERSAGRGEDDPETIEFRGHVAPDGGNLPASGQAPFRTAGFAPGRASVVR